MASDEIHTKLVADCASIGAMLGAMLNNPAQFIRK
jgi:hypothetical protein